MTSLARWVLVSLLTLGGAVGAGLVALLLWARRVAAPTCGGISPSEYVGGHAPLLLRAGMIGLLALAATALVAAVGRPAGRRGAAPGCRRPAWC